MCQPWWPETILDSLQRCMDAWVPKSWERQFRICLPATHPKQRWAANLLDLCWEPEECCVHCSHHRCNTYWQLMTESDRSFIIQIHPGQGWLLPFSEPLPTHVWRLGVVLGSSNDLLRRHFLDVFFRPGKGVTTVNWPTHSGKCLWPDANSG